jgi:hypothetical protein
LGGERTVVVYETDVCVDLATQPRISCPASVASEDDQVGSGVQRQRVNAESRRKERKAEQQRWRRRTRKGGANDGEQGGDPAEFSTESVALQTNFN